MLTCRQICLEEGLHIYLLYIYTYVYIHIYIYGGESQSQSKIFIHKKFRKSAHVC